MPEDFNNESLQEAILRPLSEAGLTDEQAKKAFEIFLNLYRDKLDTMPRCRIWRPRRGFRRWPGW